VAKTEVDNTLAIDVQNNL